MATKRALLVTLVALVSGCGSSPPAPAPRLDTIPPGALAACGGKPILASSVASAAAAQGVSPRLALEALALDARAAAQAESLDLHFSPSVQVAIEATHARALLARIRATTSGPPTDDEVAALRSERWRDFDRPAGSRVVHAIAMGQGAQSRAVAEAIHAAVVGSADRETFEQRANAVPHEGVETRVEALPVFDRKGRSLENEASFDPTFSAAADDLRRSGDISPVVATTFGYHVVFLVDRTDAYHPDNATIASLARDEIVTQRGHRALRAMLSELRKRNEVLIARNAEEIVSLLDPARSKR